MRVSESSSWFALFALAVAASPTPAQDQPRSEPKRRVLVYTVSAGFEHDVVKRETPDKPSIVEQALVDLGKSTGHFEAVLSRDAGDFTPEKLARFDLVFFYTTGELPFTKEQRDALFDFVKKGGAFAGAHCATDTFYQVPEYGDMVGAYFDGHPWHELVKVKVEDREHPATKHLEPTFEITDEIYQFKEPYDRKKLHVLMSLDADAIDLKRQNVHRTDRDFALAWCRDFEKGRVFYTALGHRPEVWKDERYLKHIDGGFRWAMRAIPEEKKDGGPKTPDAPKAPDSPRSPDVKKSDEPPTRPHPPHPTVPDGFAVDLIAEAPQLLWPSAVNCLDDGSLLVGEDRMDMPGPPDQPLDAIVHFSWKSDGTYEKKVFARDLFAVMGLEHIDGDVYVMNMPHLTRLRDTNGDGVADERKDVLTDLGPPAPGWPGGFNDHIVSGIRFGMDGFLYIAVGDKGIPLAHGTDGSTLTLRGGGVVRVKPDGSQLELVASGLRNILDVAIDERGEMFTYDNTDDGLGWWTRLTHIIEGGYYGYPWDYHDHQDRMLPCMAAYGGGSPCGNLVYREAAWPEPYRGSLFCCEWGKGILQRFELEPDGATFRVKKDERFMEAGGVKSFRPFDVCESPDGRFLYMSDWAFDSWRDPKKCGRLWRIRRADDDPKKPSVARALPKNVSGLVAALDDPSFQFRLRTQRELSRHSSEDLAPLRSALRAYPSPRQRRHALWALAASDTVNWRTESEDAINWGDPDGRAQAADAVARSRALWPYLPFSLLGDDCPIVRRTAATVIARMAQEDERLALEKPQPAYRVPPWSSLDRDGDRLLRALAAAPDRFVQFAVIQAMRRMHKFPQLREVVDSERDLVIELFRGAYEGDAVSSLVKFVQSGAEPKLRAKSLGVLIDLLRKPEPWDGRWWNIQPAKSPPPAHTVEWEKSDTIRSAVLDRIDDDAPEVRRAAYEGVREIKDARALTQLRDCWPLEHELDLEHLLLDVLADAGDEDAVDRISSLLREPKLDERLRRRAVETACAIRTPEIVELLCTIAGDESQASEAVVSCIDALARLKDARAVAILERRLRGGDEAVRAASAGALAEIEGATAVARLEPLLSDASTAVKRAALRALGKPALSSEVDKILLLVDDEAVRGDAIQALARTPDARALLAFLPGLVSKDKMTRDASSAALTAIQGTVRADIEALCSAKKLDPAALSALREIYRKPQPILRWKILGPFVRDGKEPDIAASNLDFNARFKGLDGQDVAWIDHRAEPRHGFVDLEALLTKETGVTAFAAAEIVQSIEREAEMTAGSDDMLTVWVNGAKMHDFGGDRGWSPDEDHFKVNLVSGANTILLRIGQGVGQWSFNAKISGDPSGPLFAGEKDAAPAVDYRAFALANKGDPANGYKLFHQQQGPMCIRCHTVHGTGAQVGPDLSDVAAKYSQDDIITSVLEPSKRIEEGFKTVSIELDSGQIVFGAVKSETKYELVLYDTNGETQEIEKSAIVSRSTSNVSVMPEGLAAHVTPQEFADLVAYLITLRGAK